LAQKKFDQLKDTLFSTPVLKLLDLYLPFKIELDASECVIGVVLKQEGHHISDHVKTLSNAKKNYNTYEKEFYNLVQDL
jgi:hypothetical protein